VHVLLRRFQNPESRFQNPDSRIQNPESRNRFQQIVLPEMKNMVHSTLGLNTFTSFDAPLSHDSHVNLVANTMMS